MNYAVLGATGQVGGATARALLAHGERVVAVVRNATAVAAWTAQGADVAIADLADPEGLMRAFADVDGVFVMTPPDLDSADPFAMGRAAIAVLVKALAAARVRRLVYLSSIGAQHSRGLGAIGKLHDLEQAFDALTIPSVAIRAGWFFENYRGQIAWAARTGELPAMLHPLDLAVPMVATADIGETAAQLLCGDTAGKRIVELAYPEPYSSNDVAHAIGEIVGREINAVPIARSERIGVYESWGLSSAGAAAMSDMIDGFNSGWISFEGGAAERRDARTPLKDAIETLVPPELRAPNFANIPQA